MPRIGLLVGPTVEPAIKPWKLEAIQHLARLAADRVISLEKLIHADKNIAHRIRVLDAIITRPNWGAEVTKQTIVTRTPVPWIATLSSGTTHIEVDDLMQQRIISDDSGANSDAVAEYTIWMAICLRRRLHLKLVEMAFGYQFGRNYETAGTLQGCTWAILGRGPIARRLLARLPGLGVDKIALWNRDMDSTKFQEAISCIPGVEPGDSEYSAKVPGLSIIREASKGKWQLQSHTCTIEGVGGKEKLTGVLQQADVVSIHVKHVPGETDGLLSADTVALIKKRAVVINTARHGLVAHQGTFVESLNDHEGLWGIGSDVLASERPTNAAARSPQKSEFWKAYCASVLAAAQRAWHLGRESRLDDTALNLVRQELCGEVSTSSPMFEMIPNVLVSQHISGTAGDAEQGIAKAVIARLLKNLELEQHIPKDWLATQ